MSVKLVKIGFQTVNNVQIINNAKNVKMGIIMKINNAKNVNPLV